MAVSAAPPPPTFILDKDIEASCARGQVCNFDEVKDARWMAPKKRKWSQEGDQCALMHMQASWLELGHGIVCGEGKDAIAVYVQFTQLLIQTWCLSFL